MIVALPWHRAHVRGRGVVSDFGHRLTKNGQKLHRLHFYHLRPVFQGYTKTSLIFMVSRAGNFQNPLLNTLLN